MRMILVLATATALAGCTAAQGPGGGPSQETRDMSGDMLPSAQSSAFQRVDGRLGYRNARIEYDRRGCAVYSATGPNNQPYQEVLRTRSGQQICPGR